MFVSQPCRRLATSIAGNRNAFRSASSLRSTIDDSVANLPHKFAFKALHSEQRWNYRNMKKQGDALANGLLELGLKKGDTIATWLGNDIELVGVQVAAAKAGFQIALIDPALDAAALEAALNESNATAIVYDATTSSTTDTLTSIVPELNSGKPGPVKSAKLTSLQYVFAMGFRTAPGVVDLANAVCYGPVPSPLDSIKVTGSEPYLTTFSAANGGKADGKTLTQNDVLKKADSLAKSLKLNADDNVLSTYSMSSEFGVCANFAAWKTNSVVIVPSAAFDVDSAQVALELQPITIMATEKTNLDAITQVVSSNPETLRTGVVSGGSASFNGLDLMSA